MLKIEFELDNYAMQVIRRIRLNTCCTIGVHPVFAGQSSSYLCIVLATKHRSRVENGDVEVGHDQF